MWGRMGEVSEDHWVEERLMRGRVKELEPWKIWFLRELEGWAKGLISDSRACPLPLTQIQSLKLWGGGTSLMAQQ